MEPVCIICFGKLTPEKRMQITRCSHVVHESCINNWTQQSRSCPYCRTDIELIAPVFLLFMPIESESLENVPASLATLSKKIANLEKTIQTLTEQLKEYGNNTKRDMELGTVTEKVKQSREVKEKAKKVKVEKNLSKANDKTRAPRAPLAIIDQNSEKKHYNLRPR